MFGVEGSHRVLAKNVPAWSCALAEEQKKQTPCAAALGGCDKCALLFLCMFAVPPRTGRVD